MTPTTIILTIAALAFGILWLLSLRTNARLHDIIHTRDEAIEGYKRKNFEAGTAMQRLQSRLDTANEELAGFKAGVKAAVEARTTATPPKSEPAQAVAAKPAAKPKPAPKAPAKKAAKK